MRIIGGEFGGRKLVAPRGNDTRPTADRVKEAMFSILQASTVGGDLARAPFEGSRVLDLYAGSGALGLEALSRGAAEAVFVEQHRAALGALSDNLRVLGIGARATVIASSVSRSLAKVRALGPFELALVDPPYADVASGTVSKLLESLIEAGALAPGGLLMLEHASRDAAPAIAGTTLDRSRKYGDTTLSLYRVA